MNYLDITFTFADERELTINLASEEYLIEKGTRSTYDKANTNTTYIQIMTCNNDTTNIETIEEAINTIATEYLDLNLITNLLIIDHRENGMGEIELQREQIRFCSLTHTVDANRNLGTITIYTNPDIVPLPEEIEPDEIEGLENMEEPMSEPSNNEEEEI